MKNLAHRFFVVMTVLLLVACGGGNSGTSVLATPVSISQQPVSVAALIGASAAFTVSAAGEGLVYQWQVSQDQGSTWTDIPGAVNATYTVSVVTPDLSGYLFRVKVGTGGGLISSAATLTATAVVTPAAITVQPAAQTATSGATATFSVTATGTSLAYQWQVSPDGTNWTDMAGATNATYTTGVLTASDNGTFYRAVITNSVGSVPSNGAVLTVNAEFTGAPVIDEYPGLTSVLAGQAATFSVTVSGASPVTYQWQSSTDGGTTFVDISGANDASYTTPPTVLADDGKLFRVHIVNPIGDVFSIPSNLQIVNAPVAPTITQQPQSQSVTAPATATFSVIATATPAPTYQWQVSADAGLTYANINGATSANYTTPATTTAYSGKRFRVMVASGVASMTSNEAILTVNGPPSGPGSGGSASCSPTAMRVGTTVIVAAPTGTSTQRNNGTVVFAGFSATEIEYSGHVFNFDVDTKAYVSNYSPSGALTIYGTITHTSSPDGTDDQTITLSPPFVSQVFTLAPGESVDSQTEYGTDVETTVAGGVTTGPTTFPKMDSSSATMFIGQEALVTPAGTFNTCHFLDIDGTNHHYLNGYGVDINSSVTSIFVNGIALTHN